MALHMLKLCVGVGEISELADWQERRLRNEGRIYHVTRMVPRRASEITAGGSIYWVMRGKILARQKIIEIEKFTDPEGIKRCRLIFDQKLVPVRPTPKRAFQGWRYLKPENAPPDLTEQERKMDIPAGMRAELVELGLL